MRIISMINFINKYGEFSSEADYQRNHTLSQISSFSKDVQNIEQNYDKDEQYETLLNLCNQFIETQYKDLFSSHVHSQSTLEGD